MKILDSDTLKEENNVKKTAGRKGENSLCIRHHQIVIIL